MDEWRVEAFQQLKEAIKEQTLFVAPNDIRDFTIVCNTSEIGLGVVLLQWQYGEDMPLEFALKLLLPAERNWNTYKREGFAIR